MSINARSISDSSQNTIQTQKSALKVLNKYLSKQAQHTYPIEEAISIIHNNSNARSRNIIELEDIMCKQSIWKEFANYLRFEAQGHGNKVIV